jgi:hypothetical protein
MKPHQIAKLKNIDFEKVANALMNETHQGQVHLDICEGLDQGRSFHLESQSGLLAVHHLGTHVLPDDVRYQALRYARSAYTVPKFLEVTKLRADKFAHGSAKEVLEIVADDEVEIVALKGTIKELRRRRNHILAHISEELVLREKQERERILTIEQVRTVLLAAGKIVNSLTIKWGGFVTLGFPSTDDYRRVVSMVNKYLCEQARQHDEEFTKYGEQFKVPDYARPRDCTGDGSKQNDSVDRHRLVLNLTRHTLTLRIL